MRTAGQLRYATYRSKCSIGTRLGITFGIFIVYTIVLSAIAVSQQRKLHAALQQHDLRAVPTISMMHLMTSLEMIRRHEMRLLLTTVPADADSLHDQLKQDRDAVTASLEDYHKVAADDQTGLAYELVALRVLNYLKASDEVVSLAMSGQREAATRLLLGEAQNTLDSPNDHALAWADRTKDMADDSLHDGESVYRRGVATMVALAILMVLNAVYACFYNTRCITLPLRTAAEQARRVAQGDLTVRLSFEGRDELCALFTVLNDMTSQLSNLIADVIRSAAAVETTASTLAKTNAELSYRTEQQAGSLRATATSMQQITQLGRNNSENAANADRLGIQARELAESGGDVVTRAIAAMSDINNGSSKIANIIGLINEIAFQTNLLALNAAVEAARAGDQGRGFAVVASEVRALAQRSADAAKQIKTLITESAESVRAGTELVDRTGSALLQIRDSVRDMTGLINQIASSSQEQATDVQHINQAMLQLDGATHQYALWVEQGITAAQTLRAQADMLAQHAAYFTLENGTEAPLNVPAEIVRVIPRRLPSPMRKTG
jgi:methyl-accepting chemotaxis protein